MSQKLMILDKPLHTILNGIKIHKKSKGRSDQQFQKYFSITYLGSLPITWQKRIGPA